MAVYYLKNTSTTTDVSVSDLGLFIPAQESRVIDENEINGYLTDDLQTVITAGDLVLSTTDVGDNGGDFTSSEAIEALSITSRIHKDNPHKVSLGQIIDTSKNTSDPERGLPELVDTDISVANFEKLFDGSDIDLHIHDNRYYTELELETAGSATIHWGNITNAPQFGAPHWQEPVLGNLIGKSPAGSEPTPTNIGQFWLSETDNHLYQWAGIAWVDQGAPVVGDRVVFKDGVGSDDRIYEWDGIAWNADPAPQDNWAVIVNDDGDGKSAQYIYDTEGLPPDWIKIADIDWGTHNALGGRTDSEAHPSTSITYNNSVSGLDATTVQGAIDELAIEGGVDLDNIVYVAKNGSNTPLATGATLGTIANPFATIQAAINSIPTSGTGAAASTNRYAVYVMPGDYAENVTLSKDWIYLVNTDSHSTRIKSLSGDTLTMSASSEGSTGVFNISVVSDSTLSSDSALYVSGNDPKIKNVNLVAANGARALHYNGAHNQTIIGSTIKGPSIIDAGTIKFYNNDVIDHPFSVSGGSIRIHNSNFSYNGGNAFTQTGGTVHFLNGTISSGGTYDYNQSAGTVYWGWVRHDDSKTQFNGTKTLIFKAINNYYDNSVSSIGQTTVQGAIDEIDQRLDSAEYGFSQVLYVDKGRTDTYTPTGSITYPYKSITDAMSAAGPGYVVKVSGGTYVEDFTIPDKVSLVGSGMSKTILHGATGVIVGQGGPGASTEIKGLSIRTPVTVNTGDGVVDFDDSYIGTEGYLTITTGDVRNASVSTAVADQAAVTIGSGATMFSGDNLYITATGDTPAIVHNGGALVLVDSLIQSDNPSGPTIDSNAGQAYIVHSNVLNISTGTAIDVNNGATFAAPNALRSIVHLGGIYTGTAVSYVENINGGDPTGSNILYSPATQTAYDNSTSGLSADNVQDAIDEIATEFGVDIANVYFVATNGNDTPTGVIPGTISNPFATVQAAIDRSVADGIFYPVIFVYPGTYTENLTIPAWTAIYALGREPTRIGTNSGTHSITFDSTGRCFFRGVNFRLDDFIITHTAGVGGSTVVHFEDCSAGAITYNGRGWNDYLQFRGACWLFDKLTVHSAQVTFFNGEMQQISGIDGISFDLDDTGAEAFDSVSGQAATALLRDVEFFGKIQTAGKTSTWLYNNGIYDTITANGVDCEIAYDTGSAPQDRADLISLNGGVFTRLDDAHAVAYDDTSRINISADNVQDAITDLDNAISSFKMPQGTSFPLTPDNGDLFYRTDLNLSYQYDGNRSKWLSITHMFLDWGANIADGKYLYIHGASATQTGYLMPRNGTITTITARAASGNLTKTFEVKTNHTNVLTNFSLAGGSYSTITADLDFSAGDYVQVFSSSVGTPCRDVVVMCTIAWRD